MTSTGVTTPHPPGFEFSLPEHYQQRPMEGQRDGHPPFTDEISYAIYPGLPGQSAYLPSSLRPAGDPFPQVQDKRQLKKFLSELATHEKKSVEQVWQDAFARMHEANRKMIINYAWAYRREAFMGEDENRFRDPDFERNCTIYAGTFQEQVPLELVKQFFEQFGRVHSLVKRYIKFEFQPHHGNCYFFIRFWDPVFATFAVRLPGPITDVHLGTFYIKYRTKAKYLPPNPLPCAARVAPQLLTPPTESEISLESVVAEDLTPTALETDSQSMSECNEDLRIGRPTFVSTVIHVVGVPAQTTPKELYEFMDHYGRSEGCDFGYPTCQGTQIYKAPNRRGLRHASAIMVNLDCALKALGYIKRFGLHGAAVTASCGSERLKDIHPEEVDAYYPRPAKVALPNLNPIDSQRMAARMPGQNTTNTYVNVPPQTAWHQNTAVPHPAAMAQDYPAYQARLGPNLAVPNQHPAGQYFNGQAIQFPSFGGPSGFYGSGYGYNPNNPSFAMPTAGFMPTMGSFQPGSINMGAQPAYPQSNFTQTTPPSQTRQQAIQPHSQPQLQPQPRNVSPRSRAMHAMPTRQLDTLSLVDSSQQGSGMSPTKVGKSKPEANKKPSDYVAKTYDDPPPADKPLDPRQLYIIGVNTKEIDSDEKLLKALGVQCGKISHAELVRGSDGRTPITHARVRFEDAESAALAIQKLHKTLFYGRSLYVDYEEDPEYHKQRLTKWFAEANPTAFNPYLSVKDHSSSGTRSSNNSNTRSVRSTPESDATTVQGDVSQKAKEVAKVVISAPKPELSNAKATSVKDAPSKSDMVQTKAPAEIGEVKKAAAGDAMDDTQEAAGEATENVPMVSAPKKKNNRRQGRARKADAAGLSNASSSAADAALATVASNTTNKAIEPPALNAPIATTEDSKVQSNAKPINKKKNRKNKKRGGNTAVHTPTSAAAVAN